VAERVPFVQANAAGRQSIDAALKANLGATDLRVLLAVHSYTVLWCQLSDRRSLAQVAERAGIAGSDDPERQHDGADRRVRRSLHKLASVGAVVYVPARGRGHLSTIGVPPAKGDTSDPLSDREKGPNPDRKGAKSGPEKGTPETPYASKAFASTSARGRLRRPTPEGLVPRDGKEGRFTV
jgi:hypothetical protein